MEQKNIIKIGITAVVSFFTAAFGVLVATNIEVLRKESGE